MSVIATACLCAVGQQVKDDEGKLRLLQPALDTVRSERILDHVKKLASDEFEGRAPGTRGEDLTVKYLVEQFKASGAAPGNPDGTYIQKVPLIGYQTTPRIDLGYGPKDPTVQLGQSLRILDDLIHRRHQKTSTNFLTSIVPRQRWDLPRLSRTTQPFSISSCRMPLGGTSALRQFARAVIAPACCS